MTASYSIVRILAIVVCCVVFLASSCKDDEPNVVHGNITLRVQVLHHSWPIHYLPVYLKSNATSWPGTDTSLYDRYLQTSQDGFCSFDQLYPGNYYLYAYGYDVVVDTLVIGYMPVEITSADEDKIQEVTMYVSETH